SRGGARLSRPPAPDLVQHHLALVAAVPDRRYTARGGTRPRRRGGGRIHHFRRRARLLYPLPVPDLPPQRGSRRRAPPRGFRGGGGFGHRLDRALAPALVSGRREDRLTQPGRSAPAQQERGAWNRTIDLCNRSHASIPRRLT